IQLVLTLRYQAACSGRRSRSSVNAAGGFAVDGACIPLTDHERLQPANGFAGDLIGRPSIGSYPAGTIQDHERAASSRRWRKAPDDRQLAGARPDLLEVRGGQLGHRRAPPPTGEGWAERFLAVDLAPAVPSEVRDMWEAARGLLLYGWFYYAIYAIGEHELRRVADAAILHRYQQAGGPPT